MISIQSRCASSIRACMFIAIGVGFIAASAQAQQKPGSERQLAAAKTVTPLKLPPLPRKKLPSKIFGDWTQRCATRPGTPEKKCFIMQSVVRTKDKKKQVLLTISVGFVGPDKKPGMAIRVPLGLGVLLPPGFKFNIPGIEPTQIAIRACLPIGCIANTTLLPGIIAAMKKADAGALELHTIRKQVIKIPVSFKGFTAALESLSKG